MSALTVEFTDATPLIVEIVTGLFPFSPTNTQFVPVVQLSALTAVKDEPIDESADHCVPASLVSSTGAATPLYAVPAAWQAVLEHDN